MERNCQSFEDSEKSLVELIRLCPRSLFDWFPFWSFIECSSIVQFFSSLSLVSWWFSVVFYFVRGRTKLFCLEGPSCGTNIFIQTTLIYIYKYTHVFLLYIYTHIYTLFYLISYINTPKKKKNLIFSIKVMFDDDLYKIKFIFSIFIVKLLKSFILKTNYQILY